jgi:hypothetical protein
VIPELDAADEIVKAVEANPIATQEQRAELRRDANTHYRPMHAVRWEQHETALDGLDIAERSMRALEVLNHESSPWAWWSRAWEAHWTARADWKAWKGGTP